MLIDGIGKAMGDNLKTVLPEMKRMSEENKKEYIERLTRIEAKLDAMLMVLKVQSP